MIRRSAGPSIGAGRRSFLAAVAGAGMTAGAAAAMAQVRSTQPSADRSNLTVGSANAGSQGFWPDGTRLVISVSMQFESGVQPAPTDGPFPPVTLGFEDTATASWYAYGVREGIPRLLDLWDRYQIKVTSHMLGAAVERESALANEIVARGHEAAAHGQSFVPTYLLHPDDERAAYLANIAAIEKATGTRPVGMNAFGMRHTPATLGLLQELGFLYHVDSVSSDEPLMVAANGRPLVIVPYTLRNNDFVRFANPAMTAQAFVRDLRDDFDALYEEAAHRRRMMSVAIHDRIGGAPALSHVLRDFLHYVRAKPGVTFMRKDAIAHWMLNDVQHETSK
jgi:peptidoglycan/xylan/chitin deacetylase (PgdA/CDA1 family)